MATPSIFRASVDEHCKLVPREVGRWAGYMAKLRAAVKGGLREIAGCSITEEEESTLRPGR